MSIGPKHYEGWACTMCEKLYINGLSRCCIETGNYIEDISDTPLWCPYLKHAIDQHHWDEL